MAPNDHLENVISGALMTFTFREWTQPLPLTPWVPKVTTCAAGESVTRHLRGNVCWGIPKETKVDEQQGRVEGESRKAEAGGQRSAPDGYRPSWLAIQSCQKPLPAASLVDANDRAGKQESRSWKDTWTPPAREGRRGPNPGVLRAVEEVGTPGEEKM